MIKYLIINKETNNIRYKLFFKSEERAYRYIMNQFWYYCIENKKDNSLTYSEFKSKTLKEIKEMSLEELKTVFNQSKYFNERYKILEIQI